MTSGGCWYKAARAAMSTTTLDLPPYVLTRYGVDRAAGITKISKLFPNILFVDSVKRLTD